MAKPCNWSVAVARGLRPLQLASCHDLQVAKTGQFAQTQPGVAASGRGVPLVRSCDAVAHHAADGEAGLEQGKWPDFLPGLLERLCCIASPSLTAEVCRPPGLPDPRERQPPPPERPREASLEAPEACRPPGLPDPPGEAKSCPPEASKSIEEEQREAGKVASGEVAALRRLLAEREEELQRLRRRLAELGVGPSASTSPAAAASLGFRSTSDVEADTETAADAFSCDAEIAQDSRPGREEEPSPAARLGAAAIREEVLRISRAETPEEVLGIPKDSNDASVNKAWKRLVFSLHPDKLSERNEVDKTAALEALHSVRRAREELRRLSQASGLVSAPEKPTAVGKPVCTRNQPGQRRYECRWEVPATADVTRPIEKYEVYGPRVFLHTGEPVEWVLLATLPRLEGCFVFVEESPTQQEVMWAGDRMRVPSVPLTVYSVNGRGRSEPEYMHLPWLNKFPWLQGLLSMICRQCCVLQPQPDAKTEKVQCSACKTLLSPLTAEVLIRCPKCHGEALWDTAARRLDCRLCGRHVADAPSNVKPKPAQQQRTHSLGPSFGGRQ